MSVEDCTTHCIALASPGDTNRKTDRFVNVNYPIQIGGTVSNLKDLASNFHWNHVPTDQGFSGCIKNLEINGKVNNSFLIGS